MMTRREIDRLTTEELQSKYMELQSAFDYANGRQSTKVRSRKKGRFTMRKQKLTPIDSSNRPVFAEKIGHALYRNPMAESRHLNFESRFAGELNGKLNCPSGVDPASYFRDNVENFINKIRTETVSNRNTSLREVWFGECSNLLFATCQRSNTHHLFAPHIHLLRASNPSSLSSLQEPQDRTTLTRGTEGCVQMGPQAMEYFPKILRRRQ